MPLDVSYADCSSCGFPVSGKIGDSASCPYCGTSGRISQTSAPRNLVIGIAILALGIIVGPALIAKVKGR